MARHTSVIRDHISVFQGSTAPSSMDKLSSGTREARSTVRTTPVPPAGPAGALGVERQLLGGGSVKDRPALGADQGFPGGHI